MWINRCARTCGPISPWTPFGPTMPLSPEGCGRFSGRTKIKQNEYHAYLSLLEVHQHRLGQPVLDHPIQKSTFFPCSCSESAHFVAGDSNRSNNALLSLRSLNTAKWDVISLYSQVVTYLPDRLYHHDPLKYWWFDAISRVSIRQTFLPHKPNDTLIPFGAC